MTIIESVKVSKKFVAGIFKNRSSAFQYYEIFINKQDFIIFTLKNFNYPFYIIETDSHFYYHQKFVEVEQKIKLIKRVESENHVYLNYYLVTGFYKPENPEKDFMGTLKHWHVDNRFLDNINLK